MSAIKTKRLARNLTQAQVAGALGISQEMLAMIESGKEEPGGPLAERIRRWLRSGGAKGRSVRGPYKKKIRKTVPTRE